MKRGNLTTGTDRHRRKPMWEPREKAAKWPVQSRGAARTTTKHQQLARGRGSPSRHQGARRSPPHGRSGLHNCKTVNFCCFKLPSFWYAVTVATGHEQDIILWKPLGGVGGVYSGSQCKFNSYRALWSKKCVKPCSIEQAICHWNLPGQSL